jgi:cell division protease FtsH
VAYAEDQERQHTISEQTAQSITLEVRKLIDAALSEARAILSTQRMQLDTLAGALLQHETLTGDEIRALLAGRPASRPAPVD